jgi:hypothetical protein
LQFLFRFLGKVSLDVEGKIRLVLLHHGHLDLTGHRYDVADVLHMVDFNLPYLDTLGFTWYRRLVTVGKRIGEGEEDNTLTSWRLSLRWNSNLVELGREFADCLAEVMETFVAAEDLGL